MDFENIDEELGKLVERFENAKLCLNLKEQSDKLASLLKERDSLSFWSNVDYAMQTNKEIKSLQTLFDTVNSLQDRISSVIELKKMIGEEFDINSLNDVFCEILSIKGEVKKLHIRTAGLPKKNCWIVLNVTERVPMARISRLWQKAGCFTDEKNRY